MNTKHTYISLLYPKILILLLTQEYMITKSVLSPDTAL